MEAIENKTKTNNLTSRGCQVSMDEHGIYKGITFINSVIAQPMLLLPEFLISYFYLL